MNGIIEIIKPGATDGEKIRLQLKYRRHRLLLALIRGARLTTLEMCEKFCICDPRSEIRFLRKAGHNILDEWKVSIDGVKYKEYFINQQ